MPPINEGLTTMYSQRFSAITASRSFIELDSSSTAMGTGTMLLSFLRSSKFATGPQRIPVDHLVISLHGLK